MSDGEMKIIARIKSDFPTKFGIPRQSGITAELESTVIFEKEFRSPESLRGIEGFSHLWLIWQFSENVRDGWSPTVRPPRLGGNERLGVFATRSPFRPNPIGLSCVKLLGTEKTKKYGTVLHIAGADLMDGTPIYDIKPYLPYTDSHPEALGGFAPDAREYALNVNIPDELLEKFPEEKLKALKIVLSQDPRPAYKRDSQRVYGLRFAGYEIKFTVSDGTLNVTGIEKEDGPAFTYILECSDGSLYTGWTNNLEGRVKAHNGKNGAKYTRARQPVKLVYYEEFATKHEAMSREAKIKALTRDEKIKLIEEKVK